MTIESLISELNSLFQQNQVLSTVAGGSVVVWLVSNIKNIWKKIVSAVTALISFEIVNTYEDARATHGEISLRQEVFDGFISSSKVLWERTKNLDLSSATELYDIPVVKGMGVEYKNITFRKTQALTYGFSIRVIFGKIVFCSRTIEKAQKITVNTSLRVFFARKNSFLSKLTKTIYDEVVAINTEKQSSPYIKVFNGEVMCGRKNKRSLDTIFTNNNEHLELYNAVRSFLDNKPLYEKLAYPYNFSALLYGDPGCGKSSTILALASALGRDISYVNLSNTSILKIIERINNAQGDILVFEDIDALADSVCDNREGDGVDVPSSPPRRVPTNQPSGTDKMLSVISSLRGTSLSDILNFTDGLLASEGTICLFTTNHIERLDPALLRAGRMNKVVRFTRLEPQTSARMVKSLLGWDIAPSVFKKDINPAELQSTILNIKLGKESGQDLERKFFA